jgi:hypothetical protein
MQMQGKSTSTRLSAARITASTFGVLAGVGGITHGIGEVLQGNVAPGGITIDSWTEGPIATHMGGDPAMTIVPNLLLTGALTILVSLALMIWAARLVQKKNGGRILVLLSIIILLVGGGFGSPIVGVLAGVAGTGIGVPLTGWRARLPANVRRSLARLWPWVFGVALVNGLFLFIGALILVHLFGLGDADLYLNNFYITILSLLLTILTGAAYDTQNGECAVAAPA